MLKKIISMILIGGVISSFNGIIAGKEVVEKNTTSSISIDKAIENNYDFNKEIIKVVKKLSNSNYEIVNYSNDELYIILYGDVEVLEKNKNVLDEYVSQLADFKKKTILFVEAEGSAESPYLRYEVE